MKQAGLYPLNKPLRWQKLVSVIIHLLGKSGADAADSKLAPALLLAEEKTMMSKVYRKWIQDAGWRCDAVQDMAELKKVLAEHDYAALVLSAGLKGLSADDLPALRLKERGIKLVFLESPAVAGDQILPWRTAAAQSLIKPVQRDALLQVIQTFASSGNDVTAENLKKNAPALFIDESKARLLDYHAALEKYNGDRNFFLEMLKKFVESSKDRLPVIETAINQGKRSELLLEVRSVLESAYSLKAKTVVQAAEWLGTASENGNQPDQKRAFVALHAEIENLEHNFFSK
jgi:HPt (histidine-containing phosphotransfer) domain-containing protein